MTTPPTFLLANESAPFGHVIVALDQSETVLKPVLKVRIPLLRQKKEWKGLHPKVNTNDDNEPKVHLWVQKGESGQREEGKNQVSNVIVQKLILERVDFP